jgi:hypothetical protein
MQLKRSFQPGLSKSFYVYPDNKPLLETVALIGHPQPAKEQEMAKKRINSEGTVW